MKNLLFSSGVALFFMCGACGKSGEDVTGFEFSGLQALMASSEVATPLGLVRDQPGGEEIADLLSCWILQDLDDASFKNRIRLLYLLKVIDHAITRNPGVPLLAYTNFANAIADFCRLCQDANDVALFQCGQRLGGFYVDKINKLSPEMNWNLQELMAFSKEKAMRRRNGGKDSMDAP